MSIKQELKRYIDTISEDDAKIVLAFFKRFIYREGPPLTQEETAAFDRGEREIKNGEYLTLNDFLESKRL